MFIVVIWNKKKISIVETIKSESNWDKKWKSSKTIEMLKITLVTNQVFVIASECDAYFSVQKSSVFQSFVFFDVTFKNQTHKFFFSRFSW